MLFLLPIILMCHVVTVEPYDNRLAVERGSPNCAPIAGERRRHNCANRSKSIDNTMVQ